MGGVDLVIVRSEDGDDVSVLYGRCLHRGALLSDGFVKGDNLMCGVHYWDYRLDSGVSEYNNEERLHRFSSWIENGELLVDADEISQTFPDVFTLFSGTTYTLYYYADVNDNEAATIADYLAARSIAGESPPCELDPDDDLAMINRLNIERLFEQAQL